MTVLVHRAGVDLVGDDMQVAPRSPLQDLLELSLAVHEATRVVRIGQQKNLAPFVPSGLEVLDAEAAGESAVNRYHANAGAHS